MDSVEIRLYRAADREALRDLFRRAGEGEPPVFGKFDEQVFLLPYIEHAPDSLFVASHNGELCGYLTGCLDSAKLPSIDSQVQRLLSEQRMWMHGPAVRFLFRSVWDLMRSKKGTTAGLFSDPRYPAHLHIRLAPRARGYGIGERLMHGWLERLRETRSPGCFLEVSKENERAVAFFERSGFKKHGEALRAPGMRGLNGERQHVQVMTWSA